MGVGELEGTLTQILAVLYTILQRKPEHRLWKLSEVELRDEQWMSPSGFLLYDSLP
jgi:hypothetical protein